MQLQQRIADQIEQAEMLAALGGEIRPLGTGRLGESVDDEPLRVPLVYADSDAAALRVEQGLAERGRMIAEALVEQFRAEHRHRIGHRDARGGHHGDRPSFGLQQFVRQTPRRGVECAGIAGQENGDRRPLRAAQPARVVAIEAMHSGPRQSQIGQAGPPAVPDVHPKQAAFVEPCGQRVVNQPRVGAIGVCQLAYVNFVSKAAGTPPEINRREVVSNKASTTGLNPLAPATKLIRDRQR